MSSSHNYAFFANRLRSFDEAPIGGSSARKQRVGKLVKWPHPLDAESGLPTPRLLASAGFFFSPEGESIDRVECFDCRRGLGSWEPGDNPFKEHYTRAENAEPPCAWAAARCALEKDKKRKGKAFSWKFVTEDRIPTHLDRFQDRKDTYVEWKFDGVRGSKCTSSSLARAGFVHTPEVGGDDTVTCFYCDRSLSGWEAGDDPIENHKRGDKSKNCPFLKYYDEEQAANPNPKHSKSARATQKQAAQNAEAFNKRAPVSRVASVTYTSEAEVPSPKISTMKAPRNAQSETEQLPTTDGGDGGIDARPSRKGRPPKKTKGTASRAISVAPSETGEEPPLARSKAPKVKKASSRATSVVHVESGSDPAPAPRKASKSKSATSTKSKAKPILVSEEEDEEEEEGPKTRARSSLSQSASGSQFNHNRRRNEKKDSSEDELVMAKRKRSSINLGAASLSRSTRSSSRRLPSGFDEEESSDEPSSHVKKTSSRGRRTITSLSVVDVEATPSSRFSSQQQQLRRSSRTPSQSKVNALSEQETTDVDELVRQAAARHAARKASSTVPASASASDVEGPSTSHSRIALGRSTRGIPASTDHQTDQDRQEPATTKGTRVVRSGSKKSGLGSSKHVNQIESASASDHDSHAEADDMTPQPRLHSRSSGSGPLPLSSAPIPRPIFNRGPSVLPPSARAPVNEWRELAASMKTPRAPDSSRAVEGGYDKPGDDAGPRLIAPIRKSKARLPPAQFSHIQLSSHTSPAQATFVSSPQVKLEPDDSVMMISPPRPPRSPSRIPAPVSSRASPAPPARDRSVPVVGKPHPHSQSTQLPSSSKSPIASLTKVPSPTLPLIADHSEAMDSTEDEPLPPSSSIRLVRDPTLSRFGQNSTGIILPLSEGSYPQLGPPIELRPPTIPVPQSAVFAIASAQNASAGVTLGPLAAIITEHVYAPEQLDMTLEEFIRADSQAKYKKLEAECEMGLREFEEIGRKKRTTLIEHLRNAPTLA